MPTYQLCTWKNGARGRGYVPSLGTYVYSYISITASLRISESSSTGTFCASVCASVRVGMIHPPCHTYIYIDKNTDQSLILLTTISCLLSAIQWITKMPINMFRQSRCLNTSDSICDLFKWVCDRNDRNDKGNGKSYVRANDRGLWISCHSCHLCHWGVVRPEERFLIKLLFDRSPFLPLPASRLRVHLRTIKPPS